MANIDIDGASLETIAAALRSGDLSAIALADWAIANHARRGEAFHAYKTWDKEQLRTQAAAADAVFAAGIDLGPLQGIPVQRALQVQGEPCVQGLTTCVQLVHHRKALLGQGGGLLLCGNRCRRLGRRA